MLWKNWLTQKCCHSNLGDHQCDKNAHCFNSMGSYNCECNAGYEGTGFSCADIDECETNPCDKNATCKNEGEFLRNKWNTEYSKIAEQEKTS